LSGEFTKFFLHTKYHKWVHDHRSVFSDFRVCSNCYTDVDIGELAHAYVYDACNCIYFGDVRNFNKYPSKKNFTF